MGYLWRFHQIVPGTLSEQMWLPRAKTSARPFDKAAVRHIRFVVGSRRPKYQPRPKTHRQPEEKKSKSGAPMGASPRAAAAGVGAGRGEPSRAAWRHASACRARPSGWRAGGGRPSHPLARLAAEGRLGRRPTLRNVVLTLLHECPAELTPPARRMWVARWACNHSSLQGSNTSWLNNQCYSALFFT